MDTIFRLEWNNLTLKKIIYCPWTSEIKYIGACCLLLNYWEFNSANILIIYRLDGKLGDNHVGDVLPQDKPLTHGAPGSYASQVRRADQGPPGTATAVTTGKPPGSVTPPSPFSKSPTLGLDSYACALRKNGGPNEVAAEPEDPLGLIDVILAGAGNITVHGVTPNMCIHPVSSHAYWLPTWYMGSTPII